MNSTYRLLLLLTILIGIPAYAMFGISAQPPKPTGSRSTACGPTTTKAYPPGVFRSGAGQSAVTLAQHPALQSPELQEQLYRLRQCGATYYRLEATDTGGPYRFVCEIPYPEEPRRLQVLTADGSQPTEPIRLILASLQVP
ncbi:MAG: hypothetical protein MK179_03905 [Pirellulaceae bacterium]|nr:hypothetical protein [Pirellulaceae bacterium]